MIDEIEGEHEITVTVEYYFSERKHRFKVIGFSIDSKPITDKPNISNLEFSAAYFELVNWITQTLEKYSIKNPKIVNEFSDAHLKLFANEILELTNVCQNMEFQHIANISKLPALQPGLRILIEMISKDEGDIEEQKITYN